MKFACDTCSTKYVIPDERVVGRMLRVRCKRCRSVMEVVGPRQLSEPVTASGRGDKPTDVATHRPLFSARGAGGDPFIAAGGDGDSLWQMQGESDSGAAASEGMQVTARAKAVSPPAVPLDSQGRWYVAIKGQCRGPFSDEEMNLLAQRGRVHTRTRVWKGGMAEWVRLEDCAELGFLMGSVREREGQGFVAPPATPALGSAVLDEVTGMKVAGWTTEAGKPFSNLMASHALLTQPEETPPPVPGVSSLAPQNGPRMGGTDWFVVDADAVARILEETPDRHVPGTSALVTGIHVVRRGSPAVLLASVAGALLVVTLVALLGLPFLMDMGSMQAPAVQDITARSPVATQVELAPDADAARMTQIRALGEAPASPVEPTPASADAPMASPAKAGPSRGASAASLKRVEGDLEKSARKLFGTTR